MKAFFISAIKWSLIAIAVLIAYTYWSGQSFDDKVLFAIFILAMAVAWADGRMKDRVSALELRVKSLEYRVFGRE